MVDMCTRQSKSAFKHVFGGVCLQTRTTYFITITENKI